MLYVFFLKKFFFQHASLFLFKICIFSIRCWKFVCTKFQHRFFLPIFTACFNFFRIKFLWYYFFEILFLLQIVVYTSVFFYFFFVCCWFEFSRSESLRFWTSTKWICRVRRPHIYNWEYCTFKSKKRESNSERRCVLRSEYHTYTHKLTFTHAVSKQTNKRNTHTERER